MGKGRSVGRSFVDGLHEFRPDVIAFQEAVLANGYDQVADLLGARYHVAHQAGREANGSGCSVASRWPLGEVQEVDLRVTPGSTLTSTSAARPQRRYWRRSPSGPCCSSTTSLPDSWASSTNASCRP